MLQDLFYDIASEVRSIELSKPENVPLPFDVLKGMLKRFESQLSKEGSDILPEFIDYHYTEITLISRVLRAIKDPVITGYHDRIFKNIIGLTKRVPTNLTRVFESFIKGITLFHQQLPDTGIDIYVPVYHRLQACGPGDNAFRQHFQICTDVMDRQKRQDVRQRIQTCYIERQIYDQLYKHMTLHFPVDGVDSLEQDNGHRYRLDIVKADFQSCFPNLDIEVNVVFDMHLPVSVTINRKVRGVLSSAETFTRNLVFDQMFGGKRYMDEVETIRKTEKYTYTRIQSYFESHGHWAKVANPTNPNYHEDVKPQLWKNKTCPS